MVRSGAVSELRLLPLGGGSYELGGAFGLTRALSRIMDGCSQWRFHLAREESVSYGGETTR